MTRLERINFEEWLAILFNYDEDAVVENFDDKELYKQFKEETR